MDINERRRADDVRRRRNEPLAEHGAQADAAHLHRIAGVSEPHASAGAMSIAMGVDDVCMAVTGLGANRSANTARMAGAQSAVIRSPIIKLTSSGKQRKVTAPVVRAPARAGPRTCGFRPAGQPPSPVR